MNAEPSTKNSGRDKGWYKASNLMTDKWARILGPQPFLVYHVMKSMCISDPEVTSPQACQQDWAEWCGLGIQVFERALSKLEQFGLIDKIPPGNPTHAMLYEVRDLNTVSIPEITSKEVPSLSPGNRFHDPLFEPEKWELNMYRESETPRIKRIIHNHLNGTRTVTGNGTRTVTGNGTIVRLSNNKTEESYLKIAYKGPNGPHSLLNELSIEKDQEEDGWKVISITTEGINPTEVSYMQKRIQAQVGSKDASRQTKTLKIPPLEDMPQTMQVWYSLPFVSKPKTYRVYKRNLLLLKKLSQGSFPTDYKNLLPDWTHKTGQPEIVRQHTEHFWTEEEIAHLLDTKFRQMLTDAAYWPQNKEKLFKGLSFETFVYNDRSQRSWLLELAHRELQLEHTLQTQQTLAHDPYPECTYEIAEELEISKKLRPDEYAGISRHFAKIMQFLRSFPTREEWGGIFKFANHPERAASSLAGFFQEEYSWIKAKGTFAGLLSIKGKPVRKWLEEWNEQEIPIPGRQKPSYVLDLLDEYNQYGKLRIDPAAVETSIEQRNMQDKLQDKLQNEKDEEVSPEQIAVERKQREVELLERSSPEERPLTEEEQQEWKTQRQKMLGHIARIRQHGISMPVQVDESYAGF